MHIRGCFLQETSINEPARCIRETPSSQHFFKTSREGNGPIVKTLLVNERAILVEDVKVGIAPFGHAARRLESCNLLFQLFIRKPLVVPIEPSDVAPAGSAHRFPPSYRNPFIFPMKYRAQSARILRFEASNNLHRPIGRRIINDQHLRVCNRLRQDTPYALLDPRSFVVTSDDCRYQRLAAHCLGYPCLSKMLTDST